MSLPRIDVLIFAAILVIAFPVVDFVVVRKVKRSAHPRKWFYAWTLASEWLLTLAAVRLLLRHGLALADIGEALGRQRIAIGFTLAGLVLVAIFGTYNHRQVARLSPQRLAKVVDRLGCLVPQSGVERSMFVLVSVTAGFCEEVLYRGWLWRFFGDLTGHLWIAVLLSAAAFGFAHAYQGRAAIVSTGIVGLLFSVPVLLADSLIPGQIIHAALDLMNGLLLSKAVQSSSLTHAQGSGR